MIDGNWSFYGILVDIFVLLIFFLLVGWHTHILIGISQDIGIGIGSKTGGTILFLIVAGLYK